MHQRRILCEYSDAKFKSPASLVSEIDAFVSCHYDVFCMFLHDILIDSSIFTEFQLDGIKIHLCASKKYTLRVF